jgi:signal transduction histidine kinase
VSRPAHRLQRRLMWAFGVYSLMVATLFGLYALVFMYTVEDAFFDTRLEQEAQRQLRHFAGTGAWTGPLDASMRIHTDTASLPDDLETAYLAEPRRHEFPGRDGRHYHLTPMDPPSPAARAWLVAEVSAQLVVRPWNRQIFALFAGSGAAIVLIALLIGYLLARRTAGPLSRLATRVDTLSPDRLPSDIAKDFRDDEVGILARGLDALIARVRDFVTREQEFTRDASHELRTPLAVIRSAAERLMAEPGLTDAGRDHLRHVQQSALQLEQTVTTLLSLAREDASVAGTGYATNTAPNVRTGSGSAGAGPVADDLASTVASAEPVVIVPILERVIVEQSSLLEGKAVTLDFDVPPDTLMDHSVPVLQIVFSNLIGNAFAHAGPGEVRIDVSGRRLRIVNPVGNDGDAVPWQSPRPFTKGEASEGFGLGLSILRRVCDRHGIDLRIERVGGEVVSSVAMDRGTRRR